MFNRSFTFLLFCSLFVVACSKQEQSQPMSDTAKVAAAPVKEGQGKGVVKGIDTAAKSITLDHNNIPGIMDAMSMEYRVDRPNLLTVAKVGDSVSFTLQDRGEGNFVVTTIAPISK